MFPIRNLVLIVILFLSSYYIGQTDTQLEKSSNSFKQPLNHPKLPRQIILGTPRNTFFPLNIDELRNQELSKFNTNYTNRAFIMLSGDDEFLTYAFAEGWAGKGTSSDPFIIESYRLNALTLTSTSLHVTIRGNIFDKLHTFLPPVRLYNVTNTRFDNNIVQTDDSGIFRTGILIQESQNCTIINNLIFGPHSIPGEGSNGVIMKTSHNCSLIGNNITAMTENGVELVDSRNIVISKNIINECSLSGMYIDLSTDCSLKENKFSFNDGYGVYLGQNTSSLHISMNDFINNSQNQGSQAFDEGMSNNFNRNYWNDWIEPDSNSNGVVDDPYNIDGQAGNTDPSPWSSEEKWSKFSFPPLSLVRINVLFGSILLIVIIIWISLVLKKYK